MGVAPRRRAPLERRAPRPAQPGLAPCVGTEDSIRSLSEPMALIEEAEMIRKLASGEYRLYSKKKDPKTGKRRNLGTFATRKAAEAHERAVQYFKRRG